MVTSTISGTCHHEANLARVNSFRNIFLCHILRLYSIGVMGSGYGMDSEQHIFWFAPPSLIIFQNMSDGYMSHQKDI